MSFLALDVGDKRIGLALASEVAKLPEPLMIISPDDLEKSLRDIIAKNNVTKIIVGLPKNSDGTESQQAQSIRSTAQNIKQFTGLPVFMSDESLSSKRAREFVANNKVYKGREYYDDIAACYILEEYLGGNFEEII